MKAEAKKRIRMQFVFSRTFLVREDLLVQCVGHEQAQEDLFLNVRASHLHS